MTTCRFIASFALLLTAHLLLADGPGDNLPDKVRPIPPAGVAVPEADLALGEPPGELEGVGGGLAGVEMAELDPVAVRRRDPAHAYRTSAARRKLRAKPGV